MRTLKPDSGKNSSQRHRWLRWAMYGGCLVASLAAPAASAELRTCPGLQPPPRMPGQEVVLFEMRKDYHPKNVLVVHTRADRSCRFLGAGIDKLILLDMYWRMNDKRPDACRKETAGLTKSWARERFAIQEISPDRTRALVQLDAMPELQHDLPTRIVEVVLAATASGECAATAILQLGPTGQDRWIALKSMFAEVKYRMRIPVGIHGLHVLGTDQGENAVKIRYQAN